MDDRIVLTLLSNPFLRFSTSKVGKPSNQSQSKCLCRLFVEATQILRGDQPVGTCIFISIWHSTLGQAGILYDDPRNQLDRVVVKAFPPYKPHPKLLSVSERDRSGKEGRQHG